MGEQALRTRLQLEILRQPDETTCGPTCLHAIYRYYGLELPLAQLIEEVHRLEDGGTLAVFLACHALERGFRATIYTYNLQIFDPTWFRPGAPPLAERLERQLAYKSDPKFQLATRGYLEYLRRGGRVAFEDLSPRLIRRYLDRRVPILTGLSATYLYRSMREYGPDNEEDDLRGEPQGHFVVLCGYDRPSRTVLVADPWLPNPLSTDHLYEIPIERVVGAILLGILTYDANLLILEPLAPRAGGAAERSLPPAAPAAPVPPAG
ncbi:MAG: hypothetical protein KatS3mg102_1321 [Planctomycetota bacterium]|nr:MAG: hypothetical protein KatS3mg102_1321 [Planctomycetota bacterium]